ncbi:unnamed protein product [Parnassius mnemosyne]|uniref:Uncharacterized protein n=1 Tax=Parnassius mnemosyne TaxID=213953 RepID=A0AAV1LRE8_9NEOP
MARQPRTACSALAPPRSPEAETLRVSVFRAGAKFRTASVGPAIRDAYAYVGCIAATPSDSTAPPRGNARACPGASPLATRRARSEPSLLPIRYWNSKECRLDATAQCLGRLRRRPRIACTWTATRSTRG